MLNKNIFKKWTYKYNQLKSKKFNKVNPVVIPRNHILEKIIYESYYQNYDLLYKFEKVIKNPYNINTDKIFKQPPNENEKVYQTFCGT